MNISELSPAAVVVVPPIQRTRILVVDDHPVYRHGLTRLLAEEPDLEVSGEAASAAEALAAMEERPPELVLVDVSLSGENGIELVGELHRRWPLVPIVMLSMHDGSQYALGALRSGALAYVLKHEPFLHVSAAIRAALKGETYLSPRFREQLAFKTITNPAHKPSPIARLSERELEVLQFLGTGLSTREIASTLGLSAKTVETHRAHIKDKLRLSDSNEMVRFAVDWVGQQQGRAGEAQA